MVAPNIRRRRDAAQRARVAAAEAVAEEAVATAVVRRSCCFRRPLSPSRSMSWRARECRRKRHLENRRRDKLWTFAA